MKSIFQFALFLLPVFAITSCNSNDDDNNSFSINDLSGTYTGAMNVTTPDFTNAQYNVVVTKVGSTSVKITPSGSAGSEWTATLTNVLGVYTCLSCALNNQITFTNVSGSIQLSYNYDDNNEQFAGAKQ
ncbi:MAG: hypothetical protein K9J17_08660 [Flavobacteriales bacterium]|nr:hypothetical protein [Flavobacteriales bacterium]